MNRSHFSRYQAQTTISGAILTVAAGKVGKAGRPDVVINESYFFAVISSSQRGEREREEKSPDLIFALFFIHASFVFFAFISFPRQSGKCTNHVIQVCSCLFPVCVCVCATSFQLPNGRPARTDFLLFSFFRRFLTPKKAIEQSNLEASLSEL